MNFILQTLVAWAIEKILDWTINLIRKRRFSQSGSVDFPNQTLSLKRKLTE
jgi:hypothetical protein